MSLVSIIMPTFNSAAFLTETIESILSQTFNAFELIVVDDCSTDISHKIIERISDSRLRYIRLEKNHGGPSKPRNIGISIAKGEYIALFDSDDIMLPRKLERSVAILDRYSEISVVFTDCFKFSNTGKFYPETLLHYYSDLRSLLTNNTEDDFFIISSTDAFQNLFRENYIPTSSVMVRKNVFKSVGMFDEELLNGDDRDMWFRLSSLYSLGFIDIPLHKYRVRTSGVSSRGVAAHINRIKVLEKQLESGLPKPIEKLAKKLISKNYSCISYAYKSQGDMPRAREYYLKSNQYHFNIFTIIRYLKTFLAKRVA